MTAVIRVYVSVRGCKAGSFAGVCEGSAANLGWLSDLRYPSGVRRWQKDGSYAILGPHQGKRVPSCDGCSDDLSWRDLVRRDELVHVRRNIVIGEELVYAC